MFSFIETKLFSRLVLEHLSDEEYSKLQNALIENPDARRLGYQVLAPAKEKPHGLREAYLVDADGYCRAPDAPVMRPAG